MFHRNIKLLKGNSFFLFGARGTGKSTYVKQIFPDSTNVFWIDLLKDNSFNRYARNADLLISDVETQQPRPQFVVIDEVQKIPKLLDVVHHLIEKSKSEQKPIYFALTGSSARKLKRGTANLLAGRAFQYHLFPLTANELGRDFKLEETLKWGGLPQTLSLDPDYKVEFLRAYTQTYLKEEILQEQLVRNGVAFHQFLEVTAQQSGKTLNYSKLSRDLNIDPKTVESYFQILEDTLVGFFLPAFHYSTRKSVKLQPKFYLFDLGVKRALAGELLREIPPGSSAFGEAFEHFLICEILRLNSYTRSDYQLYHYQTSAGGEIDLILKRGREVIAIEIKSSTQIDLVEIRKLSRIASALNPTKIYYASQDPTSSRFEDVNCVPWPTLLSQLFES